MDHPGTSRDDLTAIINTSHSLSRRSRFSRVASSDTDWHTGPLTLKAEQEHQTDTITLPSLGPGSRSTVSPFQSLTHIGLLSEVHSASSDAAPLGGTSPGSTACLSALGTRAQLAASAATAVAMGSSPSWPRSSVHNQHPQDHAGHANDVWMHGGLGVAGSPAQANLRAPFVPPSPRDGHTAAIQLQSQGPDGMRRKSAVDQLGGSLNSVGLSSHESSMSSFGAGQSHSHVLQSCLSVDASTHRPGMPHPHPTFTPDVHEPMTCHSRNTDGVQPSIRSTSALSNPVISLRPVGDEELRDQALVPSLLQGPTPATHTDAPSLPRLHGTVHDEDFPSAPQHAGPTGKIDGYSWSANLPTCPLMPHGSIPKHVTQGHVDPDPDDEKPLVNSAGYIILDAKLSPRQQSKEDGRYSPLWQPPDRRAPCVAATSAEPSIASDTSTPPPPEAATHTPSVFGFDAGLTEETSGSIANSPDRGFWVRDRLHDPSGDANSAIAALASAAIQQAVPGSKLSVVAPQSASEAAAAASNSPFMGSGDSPGNVFETGHFDLVNGNLSITTHATDEDVGTTKSFAGSTQRRGMQAGTAVSKIPGGSRAHGKKQLLASRSRDGGFGKRGTTTDAKSSTHTTPLPRLSAGDEDRDSKADDLVVALAVDGLIEEDAMYMTLAVPKQVRLVPEIDMSKYQMIPHRDSTQMPAEKPYAPYRTTLRNRVRKHVIPELKAMHIEAESWVVPTYNSRLGFEEGFYDEETQIIYF